MLKSTKGKSALHTVKFTPRFPRPGVIQEIVRLLEEARDQHRMLTVEEIATQLVAKFPERDEEGMIITIRAQLSRLPKERGVGIIKQRFGREMGYRAA